MAAIVTGGRPSAIVDGRVGHLIDRLRCEIGVDRIRIAGARIEQHQRLEGGLDALVHHERPAVADLPHIRVVQVQPGLREKISVC